MASSIGGGFETSIMMDVSGIRVASERGIEYMDNLSGSAVRVGQTLDRTSGETNALTESLRRAGQMVELLSAKMLAQQVSADKARIATSAYSKAAAEAAQNQRSLTSMMMGGSLSAAKQMEESTAALAKYNANLQRSREILNSPSAADPRSFSTMMMGGSLSAAKQMEESTAALAKYNANLQRSREILNSPSAADPRSFSTMMMGGSLSAAKQMEESTAALAKYNANLQRSREILNSPSAADPRSFSTMMMGGSLAASQAAARASAHAQNVAASGSGFSGGQGDGRSLTDSIMGGSLALAREKEIAEARAKSLRESIGLAEDFERRLTAAYRAERRLMEDNARFRAGAVDRQKTTPQNIGNNFKSIARDAVLWERGRVAQEGAEMSLRRMKAMLSPMIEMEMRLADEARDFKQQLDLATRSGHINLGQAKLLTEEFEEQQKLLLKNAQQQQAGFLGMRRMGFAAQQFGYAIEDAASMYGTMGLSGAFRAAGNNLTAMAAVMGPQVGVAASIAAAVASIGLHWWETKKAADATAKATDRVADLTERIESRYLRLMGINRQIRDARTADHAALTSMYEQNLQQIYEINDAEQARLNTAKELAQVSANRAKMDALDAEEAQKNAQWWKDYFGWASTAWDVASKTARVALVDPFVDNFGNGVAENAAAEEKQADAAHMHEMSLMRQENALKLANSEEKKRLDLINAQSMTLRADSAKVNEFGLSWRNGTDAKHAKYQQDREAGGYDVELKQQGMHAQVTRFGEHRYARGVLNDANRGFGGNSQRVETARDLRVTADTIVDERNRLLQLEQQQNLTIEQRLELQKQIAAANNEYLRVQQMAFDLEKRGKQAYEETNNTLMGRFEGLNEELRIQNEIVRTRQKLNEEIAIAERSGHMDADRAAAYRAEMERVFQIEEQNRKAEKEIERLKKEEAKLERFASESLAPAGVVSGLTRGSDETRKFLEQEKMRGMAQKDSEPVVAELKLLREEMKRQRSILEKNATSTPTTAELL